MSEVRRRLRDNITIPELASNTILFNFFTQAERVLNLAVNSQYGACSLTTSTSRLLYDMQTETYAAGMFGGVPGILAPGRIDKVYVRSTGVEVPRVTLEELEGHDPAWFRAGAGVGAVPELWSRIGRRLFVIYPAPTNDSVTVMGPNQVAAYAATATVLGIEDQHLPYLLDLVEALVHFRIRALPEATALVAKTVAAIRTSKIENKPGQ